MTKLIDTQHVSKAQQEVLGGKSFIEVPAIGDGNCALNAFALGLIDLIRRDAFRLEDLNKQQRLMDAIIANDNLTVLRNRLALYVMGGDDRAADYSDLAEGLEIFINFAESAPTFPALIGYIRQNSNDRLQVAALHVALAPALRDIGVSLLTEKVRHQEELTHVDQEIVRGELTDAYKLWVDGESAGPETLVPLAYDFFGINLRMYKSATGAVIEARDPVTWVAMEIPPTGAGEVAPEINLKHIPGHWNYLLPENQTQGLSAVLDTTKPTDAKLVINEKDVNQAILETEELVVLEEASARLFKKDPALHIPGKLQETANDVKMASENLLLLSGSIDQEKEPKQYETYNTLSNYHSEYSASILKSVRNNLHLSEKNIQSFKLVGDLQKELLQGKGESKKPASADERLARALQNAEILSFLSNHYTVISGHRVKAPNAKPAPKLANDKKLKL